MWHIPPGTPCIRRLFENRVLRGIFGPKGEEVAGGWGDLCIEGLHCLYCSPDIMGMI